MSRDQRETDERAAGRPTILVGCCGFPRARSEYYRTLPLAEVQQTFYRPPELATAQRWRAEAPPDFCFTLKAWQLITHEPSSPTYRKARLNLEGPAEHYGSFRPTDEVMAAWERIRQIALALQAPIVLFQCPASFTPTDVHIENLRRFFRGITRSGLICAWEPRGPWPVELVGSLCAELDLIHAVDPFVSRPATLGTAYFRLHGITGYRYRFTDDDLRQLLAWCRGYKLVYCLFNNVSMWEDALRLCALLPEAGA